MKTNKVSLCLFAAIAGLVIALFSACGSTSSSTSATINTLGPLVAEVAQARLVDVYLDKNPGKEASLLAVAAALETITADAATGTEITEAVIRGFVAKRAPGWGLTEPEQQLIVTGLLAARDAALQGKAGAVLHLGDANVKPWIDAVRRGIVAGVDGHAGKASAHPTAAN